MTCKNLNRKSPIDAFISQDGPYRGRADAWYGRYEGQPTAYRDPNYQYREPQPERPSSRTSQYSDRPSSRSVKQFQFHTTKVHPVLYTLTSALFSF